MPLHLKGNKKLYSVSELISEESLLSSGGEYQRVTCEVTGFAFFHLSPIRQGDYDR